jgi:hypothetical protein
MYFEVDMYILGAQTSADSSQPNPVFRKAGRAITNPDSRVDSIVERRSMFQPLIFLAQRP